MSKLHLIKKQFIIFLVFSFFISILAIIHGIFFDLDFSQIKRLTIEGIIVTFILILPLIIFIEWVFDLNNKKKFEEIEKRLRKVEKK